MIFLHYRFKRFNRHKKKAWIYSNLESNRCPVPHCENVHMQRFCHFADESTELDFLKETSVSSNKKDVSTFEESLIELSSLVRRN